MSQPEFKLPRNVLLNDTEFLYQRYHMSMIELTEMCGAQSDWSIILEIEEILAFERTLANVRFEYSFVSI